MKFILGVTAHCLIICMHAIMMHAYRLPGSGCGSKSLIRQRGHSALHAGLIVGLNKYSHDASCCIVDAESGKILFAQAKERFSNRKHDGGGVGEIVKDALRSVGGTYNDVELVVSNNHHFRILPFEKRLPFATAINAAPSAYLDKYNCFPDKEQLELSHHLAHAWCAASTAPVTKGLVVVMDGMGESYKAMAEDMSGIESSSGDYMHDLKLLRKGGVAGEAGSPFIGQPLSLSPGSTYREAETAYLFDAEKGVMQPVFKRWGRERSPPELYNHGFENMESIGAVYSRLSSHIFGDWNACGKVMGLAPWANRQMQEAKGWYFNSADGGFQNPIPSDLDLGKHFHHSINFMGGNIYDGSFSINWNELEKLDRVNSFGDKSFSYHANLAFCVQNDLEGVVTNFLKSLQQVTQADNLLLCGGVALNSVLNGKILSSKMFKKVLVPPCPGDEGVAIGCAMYGLSRIREKKAASIPSSIIFPQHRPAPLSPYQGAPLDPTQFTDALADFAPYIQTTPLDGLLDDAAEELATGKVVAWFQGRSEAGQRALGARSILASPRLKDARRLINSRIKKREWFRPLAPSVLVEKVNEYFEDVQEGLGAGESDFSPYMSFTATVKKEKADEIAEVLHVDGTARLQTVTPTLNPWYHRLISAFYKRTGCPMVLNTSLNGKGQPIIETPQRALQFLLDCEGELGVMYLAGDGAHDGGELGGVKVTLKPFPLREVGSPENEEEGWGEEIRVSASPFYLSEVTSNPKGEVVRVRVQDAVTLEQNGGNEDGEMQRSWRNLPTPLHLDILQLLQMPSSSGDGASELSLMDLWETIQILHGDEEEGSGAELVPWADVYSALRWLYYRGLVVIHNNADGLEDEEVSAEELLKLFPDGTEVVDLRSVT